MKYFLADPEEILVEFVAAQAKVRKVWVPDPRAGFIFPLKGRSGLSRGEALKGDEKREQHNASQKRGEARRRAADAEYARSAQERNNERTRRWRERERAKRVVIQPVCDHCGKAFETRKSLGQHRAWLKRRGQAA